MRMGAPYEMAIAAATTPPEEQGALLLPVPLFHVTGFIGMNRNFVSGGKLVLMRRWDPDTAIDLMIKEKVTSSTGVPSIFQSVLQARGLTDKLQLQGISMGGSLPPARLAGDVHKAWPDIYMCVLQVLC
jgi:acyl-CoA synthetase (AMP-forming)/AMP-acid ligase II